jgi:hypothetical protein
MSDPEHQVSCRNHGSTPETFVCVHLAKGAGCGYHASADNPNDPWPDAWCDRCEVAFQAVGAWTSENEPELALLCTHCYEEARARNASVPEPLVGAPIPVDDETYVAFTRAACERAASRQERARTRWPIFAIHDRWHYDGEAGTICFERDGGQEGERATLVADVRVVGSFSTTTNTWLWSWGNEHVSDVERSAIDAVRVFAEVRGIAQLCEAHRPAELAEGWQMAAIAADLLGAEAIYRAPMDHLQVFMLLRGFRSA